MQFWNKNTSSILNSDNMVDKKLLDVFRFKKYRVLNLHDAMSDEIMPQSNGKNRRLISMI